MRTISQLSQLGAALGNAHATRQLHAPAALGGRSVEHEQAEDDGGFAYGLTRIMVVLVTCGEVCKTDTQALNSREISVSASVEQNVFLV